MTGPLPASAGVIGWPVAHSKSPLIHRFWLGRLGLDGDYGRFPVDPAALGTAIRALPALGLSGVNVTVPHKQAVIPYLDRLEASAAAVGAVNTITIGDDGCLTGHNTDVAGFLEPLGPVPATVAVIGAGGAARAVLAGLVAGGVETVFVYNRDRVRGAALLAAFNCPGTVLGFDQVPDRTVDLLVNASALGMTGFPPLPPLRQVYGHGCPVYDLVYAPLTTGLLADAGAIGCPTIDGLAMLIGQAAAAFALFYGAAAPRAEDAALRALLTA